MKNLLVSIVLLFVSGVLSAQGNLTAPSVSQQAGCSQRIGLTDININYHSPLVKGRLIWGEVVPFGEVWRAGANENTTISFSTPVKIEGQNLPAGEYGLHMIPRKGSWTIIFSTNSTSWGSYFYDITEDALRVDVAAEVHPMQEWLSYSFTDIKPGSAKAMMRWEKIGVAFLIEVNIPETVVASMRKELRGTAGFTWEGPWQAADYCQKNKIHPDDAMNWINQSIATKETFSNLNTKAKILEDKGMVKEAEQAKTKAMSIANEEQLNAYGYQLMSEKKLDDAIGVFKTNVKRYPTSWNVYDSLAEALDAKGDTKGAIENYKMALKYAPDVQQKRIGETIKKLEKKS